MRLQPTDRNGEFETSYTTGARASLRRGRDGFTLLELTVVMALSALALGFAAVAFGGYLQRVSAQRAAQVFARDLTLARSYALRTQEPVVIRFFESARWYSMTLQESGTELVRRTFDPDGDIDLTSVDLRMLGDTLVFDARGVADLDGATSALGEADFTSGSVRYRVSFNAMGAAKVEES